LAFVFIDFYSRRVARNFELWVPRGRRSKVELKVEGEVRSNKFKRTRVELVDGFGHLRFRFQESPASGGGSVGPATPLGVNSLHGPVFCVLGKLAHVRP
jgi:hypothetical protein